MDQLVSGEMTAEGVAPLVFYDGRLNGQHYINLIEPELLSYIKHDFDGTNLWHFVQDNASCHKSVCSIKQFKKNKIKVLDWSVVSPDLNVIESLWDIIDKKLINYPLTNVSNLQLITQKPWVEIGYY